VNHHCFSYLIIRLFLEDVPSIDLDSIRVVGRK
jgi:hypothetical protein